MSLCAGKHQSSAELDSFLKLRSRTTKTMRARCLGRDVDLIN